MLFRGVRHNPSCAYFCCLEIHTKSEKENCEAYSNHNYVELPSLEEIAEMDKQRE
jgi:hypothetical protein